MFFFFENAGFRRWSRCEGCWCSDLGLLINLAERGGTWGGKEGRIRCAVASSLKIKRFFEVTRFVIIFGNAKSHFGTNLQHGYDLSTYLQGPFAEKIASLMLLRKTFGDLAHLLLCKLDAFVRNFWRVFFCTRRCSDYIMYFWGLCCLGLNLRPLVHEYISQSTYQSLKS